MFTGAAQGHSGGTDECQQQDPDRLMIQAAA
jgi:hypothetical protein